MPKARLTHLAHHLEVIAFNLFPSVLEEWQLYSESDSDERGQGLWTEWMTVPLQYQPSDFSDEVSKTYSIPTKKRDQTSSFYPLYA